jgi:carbon-monoxide dehydrogenase medium subunit
MPHWKNYHLASSVTDALQALSAARGPARLVSGGTDLLLDLQQGRHAPVDTLVDVTSVPEMNALDVRSDRLYVGAAVPLNRVTAHPLVRANASALVTAAGLVGGPQVRNTATLGGNVAHALPAADGAMALVALDARAVVQDASGCREVGMLDLYRGPGKSSLDPLKEVLVGFYLPLRKPGEGSAFKRIMRPQGVAIAILNFAVWVQRDGGQIVDARIACGPAGPVPLRVVGSEAALRGRELDDAAIEAAQEALLAEARFRTSPHRATAEYRRHMAGVLLADTLRLAWQDAV